jgi:hypothetical protein
MDAGRGDLRRPRLGSSSSSPGGDLFLLLSTYNKRCYYHSTKTPI